MSANRDASQMYEGKNSYSEVFSQKELKRLAGYLNIGSEGLDEASTKDRMITLFKEHRELRELLYRAGNYDEAEEILRNAGAGEGAKAFLALAKDGDFPVPSAEQLMASSNLKEGETRTIIAVPGSGKTTSLVYTIEGLLASGKAKADEIAVISYTTAAAGELNARMASRNPDLAGNGPHISTAHSLARSIVRKYAPEIHLDILKESEQEKLIDEVVIKRLLEDIRKVQGQSGKEDVVLFKSLEDSFRTNLKRALPGARLAPWSRNQIINTAAQYNLEPKYLYRALEIYEEEKSNYTVNGKARPKIDFEDLMWLAMKIIKENPEAKKEIQSHAKVLIVDEYQDTSPLQRAFEKFLQPAGGIKVEVGDDHQAIFTSLGANDNYLKVDAEKSRENPEMYGYYQLTTDYRGTVNCLAVANDIAAAVDNTCPKTIVPAAGADKGELPVLASFTNCEEEMKWTLKEILEGIKGGKSAKDYAVLCRWNADCEAVENLIRSDNEFKELRQYLSTTKANPIISNFIANPVDEKYRAIGEALAYPEDAVHFNNLLSVLSPTLESYSVPEDDPEPMETFIKAVRGTGYETEETKNFTKAWKAALQCNSSSKALETFVALENGSQSVSEYPFSRAERTYMNELEIKDISRTGFFDFCSWAEEEAASNSRVTDREGLNIMTIHKSKGKEFKNVFCCGFGEENLKKMMSGIDDSGDLGKEVKAKLRNESDKDVYVALTRAIKELNITYSGSLADILKQIKPSHVRVLKNGKAVEQEKVPETGMQLPKRRVLSGNARRVSSGMPAQNTSRIKTGRDN